MTPRVGVAPYGCYICGFPIQPLRMVILIIPDGRKAGWYEFCSASCAQMLAIMELEGRGAAE